MGPGARPGGSDPPPWHDFLALSPDLLLGIGDAGSIEHVSPNCQTLGARMTPTLQRILYVEDEPDIQAIARRALEAVGDFTVECSSSGAEALRMAPELLPDLIRLDVMMPGMDGPTTLGRLRALPSTAKTPGVFMTAKVQPAEVAQLRALGAIGVVAKPFDPMKLAGDLRAIWERAHG